MAPHTPQPSNGPAPRPPRPAPPLGGSLSISLTRFLETVAARRRLLADHMPQPSQEAERQAGG